MAGYNRSRNAAQAERSRVAAERSKAAAGLGRAAEAVAARFLAAQGLELIHSNFRRRLGELDLVFRNDRELMIVEVRTRSSDTYGGAAASVDWRKRRKIVRATSLLLQQRGDLAQLRVRFDVIVVRNACGGQPDIEWIQHAFQAI